MIPDPEDVLSLEPEELAGVLLEHLNSLPENEREALNRYNFSLHYTVADYPDNSRDRIWWLHRRVLRGTPHAEGLQFGSTI